VDQGFLWGALGTLEWLKELLQREREQAVEAEVDGDDRVELELDPQRFVTRPEGRRAWLREGRRALEAQRERERRPIAGDRADRLLEACRRLEQELDADRAANAAYEHWRAHGVAADGSRRMAPGAVKPFDLPDVPTGLMNVTDHDSRVVRTQGQPGMQGYNGQLAVNDRQIIVAAEITTESPRPQQREALADQINGPLEAVVVAQDLRHPRRLDVLELDDQPAQHRLQRIQHRSRRRPRIARRLDRVDQPRRCPPVDSERYSAPAADTETSDPAPGMRRRETRPRSVASSHTGRRGHEVRQAFITSA
jgi:hypothetical protein